MNTIPGYEERAERLVSPCGYVFKEWWGGEKGRNSEGGKYWADCQERQNVDFN